jgi:hypothetical protein
LQQQILLSATIAGTGLTNVFGLHSQLDKEMFHATCHTIMIQVAEKIALFI